MCESLLFSTKFDFLLQYPTEFFHLFMENQLLMLVKVAIRGKDLDMRLVKIINIFRLKMNLVLELFKQ
jgi:hypothetical protein